MKSINEAAQSASPLNITKKDKRCYITGIFMQSEKLNRNGRTYGENVLDNAAKQYIEDYINTGKSIGEINHPDRNEVSPDLAAIRVVKLWKVGEDWYGKALVLNTEKGKELQNLINDGFIPGISSRGIGESDIDYNNNEIVTIYKITSFDIVNIPSAYDANLQAIYEGARLNNIKVNENKVTTDIINFIKNYKF